MHYEDFPLIVIGKSKRVKAEDFLKWVEAQRLEQMLVKIKLRSFDKITV